mmetsp:Transcript_74875/g.216451  ORF Transcript_74875/g.216451 Transcript_74875/m.216451 type:complete len:399 (+) Transcript_74875:491-1687(+)
MAHREEPGDEVRGQGELGHGGGYAAFPRQTGHVPILRLGCTEGVMTLHHHADAGDGRHRQLRLRGDDQLLCGGGGGERHKVRRQLGQGRRVFQPQAANASAQRRPLEPEKGRAGTAAPARSLRRIREVLEEHSAIAPLLSAGARVEHRPPHSRTRRRCPSLPRLGAVLAQERAGVDAVVAGRRRRDDHRIRGDAVQLPPRRELAEALAVLRTGLSRQRGRSLGQAADCVDHQRGPLEKLQRHGEIAIHGERDRLLPVQPGGQLAHEVGVEARGGRDVEVDLAPLLGDVLRRVHPAMPHSRLGASAELQVAVALSEGHGQALQLSGEALGPDAVGDAGHTLGVLVHGADVGLGGPREHEVAQGGALALVLDQVRRPRRRRDLSGEERAVTNDHGVGAAG